jgi:hypothetical protein
MPRRPALLTNAVFLRVQSLWIQRAIGLFRMPMRIRHCSLSLLLPPHFFFYFFFSFFSPFLTLEPPVTEGAGMRTAMRGWGERPAACFPSEVHAHVSFVVVVVRKS